MRGAALLAVVALAGGCVLPATGAPPPRVDLVADAGAAQRHGRTGAEVLRNPAVASHLPDLFGRDWSEGGAGISETRRPAGEFFALAGEPRALRVGERDWVAVTGCLPAACATHRGLLLVGADGRELRARLDEAGFRHHYGFGPGLGGSLPEAERAAVDAAWRAVERIPSAWPSAR